MFVEPRSVFSELSCIKQRFKAWLLLLRPMSTKVNPNFQTFGTPFELSFTRAPKVIHVGWDPRFVSADRGWRWEQL